MVSISNTPLQGIAFRNLLKSMMQEHWTNQWLSMIFGLLWLLTCIIFINTDTISIKHFMLHEGVPNIWFTSARLLVDINSMSREVGLREVGLSHGSTWSVVVRITSACLYMLSYRNFYPHSTSNCSYSSVMILSTSWTFFDIIEDFF